MRKLYTAANLPEAYMLLDQLRAAAIDAHVFNENAQGGLGEIPFTHAYPELWVMDDADWARGREVISAYEHRAINDTASEVRCPSCRETNPANFQLCWQCGTAL